MDADVKDDAPVRDAGQAIGLVLMSIGLVAAISFAIGAIATSVMQTSRAQNAADAAALAGVGAGAAAAAEVAARNGGHLLSFESTPVAGGSTVTVEVSVGAEHAVARASDAP